MRSLPTNPHIKVGAPGKKERFANIAAPENTLSEILREGVFFESDSRHAFYIFNSINEFITPC